MGAVKTERIKLTAAYLNTMAGGFFTAGVAAPIAAAVFGISGPAGNLSALTVTVGALIFLAGSLALHAAARYILKGLEP